MTLRHIRIFLAVCENGNNITRAAEQLLLAQPAVSLAVRELERYYGVKFFDRISRRLYLTETGKRFRGYAEHIASLFDQMEKDLRDGDAFGVLRIGCSITIGSQLMPSYVRQFSEQYPGLEVYVHIERSEWLEEAVLRNELDLALIEGLAHAPDLISEDYLDDELVAVCSPEGPFRKGELVDAERFLCQRLLLRDMGGRGLHSLSGMGGGEHCGPCQCGRRGARCCSAAQTDDCPAAGAGKTGGFSGKRSRIPEEVSYDLP